MKTQQQPKQQGSFYLQFLERRSIPLYKQGGQQDETHLCSFPIEIDRGCFQKTLKEKENIKFNKKDWKNSLPPNYKPQLLIRA